MSSASYGIYAGSPIHEVAQVVAAGRSISQEAADTAVITKMVRVMMLAPFLAILSTVLARTAAPGPVREPSSTPQSNRTVIPWFALGFVAVAACNSLDVLPRTAVAAAAKFDTILLVLPLRLLGALFHT